MRSTTMALVNYTKVLDLDLTEQLDLKAGSTSRNFIGTYSTKEGKTKPSPESLRPYFGFLGTLDASVQVDMESESESDNAEVDLPSSDFSMSSANRRWAGLEDGDGIMMSELPSALERDRTSAVLSRKATTTIIIDGYIPESGVMAEWKDSVPGTTRGTAVNISTIQMHR